MLIMFVNTFYCNIILGTVADRKDGKGVPFGKASFSLLALLRRLRSLGTIRARKNSAGTI